MEFAHVSLVRALLVFDADTSLVNNQAQTPYKLALKMMQESGLIDAIGLGVTLKGIHPQYEFLSKPFF